LVVCVDYELVCAVVSDGNAQAHQTCVPTSSLVYEFDFRVSREWPVS